MALDIGDAKEGTGLAGLIAEKLSEETEGKYKVKKGPEMPNAIAKAIVEYLQANLELNDLSDVSVSSPANGETLTYNSGNGEWENQ